ncbi:MAG: LacI family DNA-binding transcriptional regulator [Litoreibacter sp.]
MPKQPIIPTLDDVAHAAGVSTATVSRCLNEQQKVAQTTREKVMRAVNELGYTPNFNARAMAARRTHTIGAIIPTMENAIFARGLQAFQETLNDKGYTLLVSSTGYDPDREAEQVKNLVARGADGLLLIGYERTKSTYSFLKSRQIPYMLAWAHRFGDQHPAIGFDNRDAMVNLTQAVLQHGHRDIGIISGVRAGNDRATDRVAGIRMALREANIDPDRSPLIETPYSIDNGAEAFADLMQRPIKPTAVMCINDVLAAGALQRARDLGVSVPNDVSITGFDDIELASLISPKLTTVHVPHRHMGSLAAQVLISLVEKQEACQSFKLESPLRIRETLGPARR